MVGHVDPGTGLQRVERLTGEQAVVGHHLGREVDAVVGHVGRASVDELADQVDHAGRRRRWRGDRGRGGPRRWRPWPRTRWPRSRPPPRPWHAELGGPGDDLVVDVGDVRHVGDLEAAPLEVAAQHVEHQREAAVPEVRAARRRWARTRTSTPCPAHGVRWGRRLPGRCRTAPARAATLLADSAAPRKGFGDGDGTGGSLGGPMSASAPTPRDAWTVPDKPTLDGLEDRWGQAWEDARHLPLRPHRRPRRGLLDRHAAADGQRVAARRPRLQLHPHRHHRPLPAHAGQARSSTRWAGTTTACPPSAGSRTTTACRCDPSLPYDPDFAVPTPVEERTEGRAQGTRGPDQPPQLRRAVRPRSPPRTRRPSRSSGATSACRSTGR